MRGHVAPAATVPDIGPQETALAVTQGPDSRLCRCLRCDAWIDYTLPDESVDDRTTLPPEDELPKPLRGRALDERITIRGIAVLAWLNAVLFALVSVLLLVLLLGLPTIQDFASIELQHLQTLISQYRPASSIVPLWEQRIDDLQRWQFAVLLALAVGYTMLQVVEAVFLWKGRRWAEYLTAIESMFFLPYLGYNVIQEPTPLHVGGLALQLAIIAYLVLAKRLFGVRGGYKRLQEIFGVEVNWRQIYSHPPTRQPPTEAEVERSLNP
ncbi:MAG: DUF2127 domain-containing protein [Actinomycetia bacterium]|nr:DUF2127 domain-containing protein [Actinomycetes bacterium]